MAASPSPVEMAAPPVPVDVPFGFANLPRFANRTLPLILSALSTFYLLVLLIRDVFASYQKKKIHWIPGKHLILGALSIQLLTFVEHPIVSISDDRKLNPALVKELFQRSYDNQVLILGGRVLMCVLIGIMLPEFASSRPRSRLNDWLALGISAFAVLFQIEYVEILLIDKNYVSIYKAPFHKSTASNWLVSSNSIIFFSVLLLAVVMTTAAEITSIIRKILVSVMKPPVEGEIEERAVRLWIRALTSQPHYIIARSILTSSTCFFVTVCVVLYILELLKTSHAVKSDLAKTLFVSQWVFISFGWMIVCWRCIAAVVYYPTEMTREGMREEALRQLDFFRHGYSAYIICYPLAIINIIFWLILKSVFSNSYMRRLFMSRESRDQISVVYNRPGNDPKFINFSSALIHMPWEKREALWIANRKSIDMALNRLKPTKDDTNKSSALILLLKKTARSSPLLSYTRDQVGSAVQYFPKRTPKMMAVTLLTVIIELSGFFSDPNNNMVTVTNCIDACNAAWTIMGFVEKKDPEAALVNKEANILIRSLVNKKSHKWLGLVLPINEYCVRSIANAKTALKDLEEEVNKKVKDQTRYEPLNSKASIAVHNFKEVCQSINNDSLEQGYTLEGMLDAIRSSLADVIRSCVFKVQKRMIKECRLEAWDDMEEKEEKLWNLLKIARMTKGIEAELPPS